MNAEEQTIEAQKVLYKDLIQETMQLIQEAISKGNTIIRVPLASRVIRPYLESLGYYTEYGNSKDNYLYVSWWGLK